MQQPSELFLAIPGGLLWLLGLVLMFKYKPARQWPRFLIWLAGWSAASHLSKAFDAPGHLSVRSEIIPWGIVTTVVFMLIQSRRNRK